MLKWLLTGGHLGLIVALLFMASLAISYYALLFVHHYTYEHLFVKENKFVILAIYASSIVLFALMMTILIFTKQENQYDGDWKVVQTDDKVELKITVKESRDTKAKDVELTVNKELGEKAALLKNNEEYIGKIEAVKDGKKEIRRIEVKSINDTLLPNSKISKVEYRKIIGYQQNLFGLMGYIEPSEYDGELRLTVEQSGNPELEHLFEKE